MTSSPTVELRGVAVPQLLHLPPDVASLDAATEVIELAESVGLVLDEAQRFRINAFCGERADGSWAASDVVDVLARQNGKGETMIARQLAGLFLFGESLQIHTAHEFPTANEAFLRLVGWIESSDELRAKVARIRYANGEQGVELLNGCRLKYRARTGGSGRGFAGVSTLYYDEAMYLTDAHMAASKPALSTHPNPQTWYASSAGLSSSLVLWQLRKRALRGDAGRFAYCENTAETVSIDANGRVHSVKPDPDDRGAWAAANTTLGARISVEYVESERGSVSDEVFLRERLTVWDPEAGSEAGVWPPEVWQAVVDKDAAPSGALFVGVDQSPDRSLVSVAVAGGGVVEIVEPRPSVASLVGDLVALASRASAPVAFDPAGPVGWIKPELERAGVPFLEVSGQRMGQACGALFTAVQEGQLRVRRHPDLERAVSGARTLPKGDVWVWARKDGTVDVSPLVAVTLAWWAASQAGPAEPKVFAY